MHNAAQQKITISGVARSLIHLIKKFSFKNVVRVPTLSVCGQSRDQYFSGSLTVFEFYFLFLLFYFFIFNFRLPKATDCALGRNRTPISGLEGQYSVH